MTATIFPLAETPATPAGAYFAAPGPASRRVVDATTRMLHWLMALSFAGAYVTADGERWRLVHVTLGYTLTGLLICRVLWGLFGPRQVRLSVMARKLKGFAPWLKSLGSVNSLHSLQPAWRQGQNLLMASAGALMLGMVLPLALSGYAVWAEWGGEWLEEAHELFGNAMLALVLAHIGLIVFLSFLRRKNQALPMLTGRAAGSGPDVAKRNHGVLALLLLTCVVGFWGWQWIDAPQNEAVQGTATIDNRRNHDSD